ncbi:MAG: glycosyltransferase family 25 protein [Bacteroidetes bacterium]|nr:glycosyltransferase family 25 protein [Bacteroidota bacterium]
MNEQAAHTNKVLHQYFDKVLVLTVARFTERHEKVKQRLTGIDFDFFYGTDKNDLTPERISREYVYDKKASLAVRQQFPEMNLGEIACSLSHCNIYEAIIQHNWQRVLILEDDVVPDYDTLPSLGQSLQELPTDWELVYLGYLKNERATTGLRLKQVWYKIMRFFGLSQLSYRQIGNLAPAPFGSQIQRAGFHDCTHAYAVSLEGAKKLLKAQTPVRYRADNLLTALVLDEAINGFAVKQNFFNQEIFTNSADTSYVRVNKK